MATFDAGLYFNAGPMRISHHHHTTLAYCRELQVATEVFVPDCESAYLAQTRGPLAGKRVRLREARADFDGYIAELLSKALSQAQLDQPLTNEDRDRLLSTCVASARSMNAGSIAAHSVAAVMRRCRWAISSRFPAFTSRPTGPPSRP
jgi:monoamine oxidase